MDKDWKPAIEKAIANTIRDIEEAEYEMLILKNRLKGTKTIPEFMETKREMILTLMNALPLQGHQCPFCTVYVKNTNFPEYCDDCWYGKKKGICGSKQSVLHDIKFARERMYSNIIPYWRPRDSDEWKQEFERF